MDLKNWNEEPPSVTLLDSSGVPLKILPEGRADVFHAGPHQRTQLPFICMAGTLEYHEVHKERPWEQFKRKPGYDIGEILDQLWHAWLKGWGK